MSAAPFKATITIGIWEWDRQAAADALEQLVEALVHARVIVRGGGNTHCDIEKVAYEARANHDVQVSGPERIG